MTASWLRRGARLALALGTAAVLAACGSSTTESAFTASRVVSFGDGLSDVGFNGGARYTVNDGTVNVFTQQVAARYGIELKAQSAGGTGYARGGSRVTATPDVAGNAATLTTTRQIDAFLAGGGSFGSGDLVLFNGGISDIVAQNQLSLSDAERLANVRQAARDLAGQVRRAVGLGARYVGVVGTYDLGRSPWGRASGRAGAISAQSQAFNEALLVALNDLGNTVLYVDAAYYFNLLFGTPNAYGITNIERFVCTSGDAGAGIGVGTGEVNSALCNPNTLAGDLNAGATLFADKLYFTPTANRQFGDYVLDRLRNRF